STLFPYTTLFRSPGPTLVFRMGGLEGPRPGGMIPGSRGCIDFGGGIFGSPLTDQLLQDIRNDPTGVVTITVQIRVQITYRNRQAPTRFRASWLSSNTGPSSAPWPGSAISDASPAISNAAPAR